MGFSRKSQKYVIFLGKMQEVNASEAIIGSFQEVSVKYLPFPHPDISLMTKDLSQIKVYNYRNIGDAKTLVKLKEKKSKFSRSCSGTHLLANLEVFFALLVLTFSQVTKLLTEIVTTAYSLLE